MLLLIRKGLQVGNIFFQADVFFLHNGGMDWSHISKMPRFLRHAGDGFPPLGIPLYKTVPVSVFHNPFGIALAGKVPADIFIEKQRKVHGQAGMVFALSRLRDIPGGMRGAVFRYGARINRPLVVGGSISSHHIDGMVAGLFIKIL